MPQPLLASVGVWQGLVAQSRYEAARPEEMLLLEKQGLSSQQQRMPDALDVRSRSGSLPPSSLPRPRRSHGGRRLGEYGRLSDGESTRKTSTNSSLDGLADAGIKGRDSLPPMPRKLGEYGRLSDSESGRKMSSNSNDSCKVQESSSRSYLPPPRKLSDYGKLSANSSNDSVDITAKTRDSPARFLPPSRKMSDSSRASDSDRKLRGGIGSEAGMRDSGTSEDSSGSKLRLIPTPTGRVMNAKRASSLQRDTGKPTHPSDSGLRSLPSNKYRVQF